MLELWEQFFHATRTINSVLFCFVAFVILKNKEKNEKKPCNQQSELKYLQKSSEKQEENQKVDGIGNKHLKFANNCFKKSSFFLRKATFIRKK